MWQGAEFVLPHINKKTANSFGCFYKNAYLCSRIVLWCNGRTTGFGSVCGGSNPPRTTFKETLLGSPFFVAKKSTISPSRCVTHCRVMG